MLLEVEEELATAVLVIADEEEEEVVTEDWLLLLLVLLVAVVCKVAELGPVLLVVVLLMELDRGKEVERNNPTPATTIIITITTAIAIRETPSLSRSVRFISFLGTSYSLFKNNELASATCCRMRVPEKKNPITYQIQRVSFHPSTKIGFGSSLNTSLEGNPWE